MAVVCGNLSRQPIGAKLRKKEKELIKDADAIAARAGRNYFAKLLFPDAAEEYITDRSPNLSDNTIRTERERLRIINQSFSKLRVSQITVHDVQVYIRQRKAEKVSNATVNRELDIIRGVLKKAKLWRVFSEDIKNLKVEHNVGRALEDHEKEWLLRIAESRPEWQAAFCGAVLALNTTMRGVELKNLRWQDVDLHQQIVTVRRSKTEAGKRSIPLNGPAMFALQKLWRRSQFLGATLPTHYVFFACENGLIDREKPQKSWRTAWRNLTRIIACPSCGELQSPSEKCVNEECGESIQKIKSPLSGLRFHDLRHSAITELAESQASDSVIRDIAGHVSPQMLKHYSHIRLAARRSALEILAQNTPRMARYDTNHVTKALPAAGNQDISTSEAADISGVNLVELVGIEPPQWIENIQLANFTMFSKSKRGPNSNSAVQIGTTNRQCESHFATTCSPVKIREGAMSTRTFRASRKRFGSLDDRHAPARAPVWRNS